MKVTLYKKAAKLFGRRKAANLLDIRWDYFYEGLILYKFSKKVPALKQLNRRNALRLIRCSNYNRMKLEDLLEELGLM